MMCALQAAYSNAAAPSEVLTESVQDLEKGGFFTSGGTKLFGLMLHI